MNDESVETPTNIINNFKTLSKSICSAQSNIFRCKSTLKCIEEELLYLNVNNNTNTNNKESKKMQIISESPDQNQNPYNLVEIDAEPTKAIDYFPKSTYPDTTNRNFKSKRSFSKILMPNNTDSNHHMLRNTNVCNISGELTNLMRAQQKLISQIEQLKCEIGDKSCAIDTCVKDNQYFSCKFKEVDSDIDQLKKDIEKIKKDMAMASSRDRGFSPYSPESLHKDINFHSSLKPVNDRMIGNEHHFGYQDVCTPDNSFLTAPLQTKSNRNLLLNLRDPGGHSRTFEDLMRKSKLDIDCNINNCRNNQNVFSITHPAQSSPVLQDFASLTNQIKNLRKMAESIFKGNIPNNSKKSNTCNHAVDSRLSKNIDFNGEDYSKSSLSKPMAETTLSMLNQSNMKSTTFINPSNVLKGDTNSERTSMSGSDTSACFYTEDQFPVHSPTKNSEHLFTKTKVHEQVNHDRDLYNNQIHGKYMEKQRRLSPNKQSNGEYFQQRPNKSKENQKNVKKQVVSNGSCALWQYSKSFDASNSQRKNQLHQHRPICPECNQYLTIVSN